jgi:large subunit ribosomal protein L25
LSDEKIENRGAIMKFEIAAEARDQAGKGVARKLRRSGRIPGVLYGQGECLLLTLDPVVVTKILRSPAGSTALITLNINGASSQKSRTALFRDWQVDPVSGDLLHVDLFEVSMSKAIRVKVPVNIIGGTPAGLKEGGVLHHNLRELHIECLPASLPEAIDVDASELKIGQGIHIKELHPGEGIKLLDEADQMVVSVAAPMSEAKLEALLTSGAVPEEGKEPEVIGKPKEEGAEAAAAAEPQAEKKETKEAKEEKKK